MTEAERAFVQAEIAVESDPAPACQPAESATAITDMTVNNNSGTNLHVLGHSLPPGKSRLVLMDGQWWFQSGA